jgi:hypothetical protein
MDTARGVRGWFGLACGVCWMVGVDPTDAERLEHWRPDVSVPTAQAVGGHAEARGALCEVRRWNH